MSGRGSGRRPTEEEVRNTNIVPHSGSTNGSIHPETTNNSSLTESRSARGLVDGPGNNSNSEQQYVANTEDSVARQNGDQRTPLNDKQKGIEGESVNGIRETPQSGPEPAQQQQQQAQAPNGQKGVNQSVSFTNNMSGRVPVNPNTYQQKNDQTAAQPGQQPQQGKQPEEGKDDKNSKKNKKGGKKSKLGKHVAAHIAALCLTFWACTCCCHVPCCL